MASTIGSGRFRHADRSAGMDPDDQHFEDVRRRRGYQAAHEIWAIARVSKIRNVARAWRWAEDRYDLRHASIDHGCGYDPEEPGGA